jgi:hypothetical protein
MAIFKINPEDLGQFTVVTNPVKTYSSSSFGTTGSIKIFARQSHTEKDSGPTNSFIDAGHDDADIASFIQKTQRRIKEISLKDKSLQTPEQILADQLEVNSLTQGYMQRINSQSPSKRKQKKMEIWRFTPTTQYTINTARKLLVKDILNKYHRVNYPMAHWAYSNYNSLNFFTASSVPSSSVLLYPNLLAPAEHVVEGYESGIYNLNGPFSFEFYINPRHQQDSDSSHFHAGTIFHLSSSYALSLISGSSKDENGLATGFRIQLQLSHSADISPSLALPGDYPNDLTFLSDDNSISLNKWHRVIVRWGTNDINFGTGSFNIDGIDKGIFSIPSSTVSPRVFEPPLSSPEVLCVGNFWESTNDGVDSINWFFSSASAQRDGLELLNPSNERDEPRNYFFRHPLNAELHDLSIKRKYMSNLDINSSQGVGPSSLGNEVAFYCPPFFTETSPYRQFVGTQGGVIQSPFFEANGTTNDPFNVALSFGCNGHYINLENFCRDFANDLYPRLHHLTASVLIGTTDPILANDWLYSDPRTIKRNLTILPCDDGNFVPNYNLLAQEERKGSFSDDNLVQDLSLINLSNLLSTSSLLFGAPYSSFEDQLIGFTPENTAGTPGPAYLNFISSSITNASDPGIYSNTPLTIYQRTQDPSSNQVTFFDISNLFYGKQIHPGSFQITDSNLSGSSGKISITLRDDGRGNLYRADSDTPHATWSSCGNIYYSEGIVVIKSPHLYFYGKEQFEISFKGEQNLHVLKVEALAPQDMLNSSSNPSYIPGLRASDSETDTDPNFVYITNLNFHDENLNVVAKTQLAQPILKRFGDKIMFKVTLDF